jgi:hypothetical protein
MAGRLPLRNRIEKFVGPPQEHAAVVGRFAARCGSVSRHKRSLAMLACHTFSQILDANLKPSSARWAPLNEIRGT